MFYSSTSSRAIDATSTPRLRLLLTRLLQRRLGRRDAYRGVDDAKKATARAAGDGVARPLRRRRRFLRRNRRAVASQRHQKPPGSCAREP